MVDSQKYADVNKNTSSVLEYLLPGLLKKINGPWSGLLSLICGALIPLSFAPFNTIHPVFSYLIFFPLALFLWQLLNTQTTRKGFYKGWLFGIGLFAVGVSWLYVAIHDFGGAHWSLAALFTGLFIAFLALFYALTGYLIVKLKNTLRMPQPLLVLFYIPLLWVFMEWLRTWFLTGFPWLLNGYPMIQTPLAGYAPLVGIYGLSFLVVFLSALLLVRIRPLVSIILAVIIFAGGAWLATVQWSHPQGQPLKVAMVQGNVNQAVKWSRAQLEKTKAYYVSLSKPLWTKHDIIVWPENAIPSFYHNLEHGFYSQLSREAKKTDSELVAGLPVYNAETQQYYNAVTNLGGKQGFYYKTHLVPFGEYVPLASVLRGLMHFFNMPMSGFSAGSQQQPLLTIKGYPVVTTICYEDVFSSAVIKDIPQAYFMINLSNNGWYGNSFAPPQHLEMARMRALETSRDLIRSTTSGITALVDNRGQVKVNGPQFKATVVSGEIQPRQGITPYVYYGNSPLYALFSLAGLYLLWLKKKGSAKA